MKTVKKHFEPALLLAIIGLFLAFSSLPLWLAPARAADGEGAYTERKARAEGYLRDKQSAVFRENIDGTDVLTNLGSLALVTDGTLFLLFDESSASDGVRQNLSVSVRFSDAGDAATVWAAFYYFDGTDYFLLGVDQPKAAGVATTLDATAAQDGDGNFMSHTFVFDTYGATHVLFPVTGVTIGTCDLWVGSF